MKQPDSQLQQIDAEIAKLESLSSQENDPDKKVAYMKRITTLKQRRSPLHYKTLSEKNKYKYLEGMYAMHSKMASDGRCSAKDVFASFYAKAYSLDSRCDRFFAGINKTFKINLEPQPHLAGANNESVPTANDEDLFWDFVAKRKARRSSIDLGNLIGKVVIYGFVGLGIFFQAMIVYREGIKGFGLSLFFLCIAAPVYGYGVWKGRQQVGFYQQLAQSVGLRFSSAKGPMPLFLYWPLLQGSYKGHEFTLRLHQTRPRGYIQQNMTTESLLEVSIPPLALDKTLNLSLNLNKTDPKWVTLKKQANDLIGPDLVKKVLADQQQGAIKWEIKINRGTVTYSEFGPISSVKMIETFRHAFDLLAMIADAIKADR